MRIISQLLPSGFELCPRLGLVFAPAKYPADEHAVACARRVVALAEMEAVGRGTIGLASIITTRQAAFNSVALVHANNDGKIVDAVLPDSPAARSGLAPRDIIIGVNNARWISVRHLVFSDRRSSELKLKVFVARYVSIADITVRVTPAHYLPIEDIVTEAMAAVPNIENVAERCG